MIQDPGGLVNIRILLLLGCLFDDSYRYQWLKQDKGVLLSHFSLVRSSPSLLFKDALPISTDGGRVR